MNLATWVERQARLRSSAPALAEGDRPHADWAGFATRTAAVAGGLRGGRRGGLGLVAGDRVAILMRNRPEYLEALFAVWHAGLVVVPVNARLHPDEISYLVDTSGARGDRRPRRTRRRRRAARRQPRCAAGRRGRAGIWPPFADVPTSKTLEDLRVLNDEILPAVHAA